MVTATPDISHAPDATGTPAGHARLVVTALLLVVALAGVALSTAPRAEAAPPSPAGGWAKAICQAIGSYKQDVAKLSKTFGKTIGRSKSLSEVKAGFTSYLRRNVARAHRARAAIRTAGVPNVPNGRAIAAAFAAGFTQLETGFTSLVTEVQSLPTDTVANFNAAVQTLEGHITDLQTQNQAIFAAAQPLETPQLQHAVASQAACKAFQNAG